MLLLLLLLLLLLWLLPKQQLLLWKQDLTVIDLLLQSILPVLYL